MSGEGAGKMALMLCGQTFDFVSVFHSKRMCCGLSLWN